MIKINLGERNEMILSSQSEQYKANTALDRDRKKEEKTTVSPNEVAKREMATELINQGFSEEAICRILHISPDQMPEACS